MSDSHARFTSRVGDYVRARPTYPAAVAEVLRDDCGLAGGTVVADLGSGTGLLSRLFLDAGCHVYGVEPNDAMREAAARVLEGQSRFVSVKGSAETTSLDSGSMDSVVAGQAFHWFEPLAAGREARRILCPGGWAALIWNCRSMTGSRFIESYQQLLERFSLDTRSVARSHDDPESIGRFFAPAVFQLWHCANFQLLDYEGLKGRLLSASYAPPPGHERHGPMIQELQRIFDVHSVDGRVQVDYDTRVYCGQL